MLCIFFLCLGHDTSPRLGNPSIFVDVSSGFIFTGITNSIYLYSFSECSTKSKRYIIKSKSLSTLLNIL